MAHTPAEIANEFVKLAGHMLPQMKLQKLTFIANGWSLAITGEPLVAAKAEAWDNGPVYRGIWDRIRDLGLESDGRIRDYDRRPCETHLIDQEAAIVRHVWHRYGSLSAQRLSDLTHQPDTPWTQTYFGAGQNAFIPNEVIAEHYRELALAGRARNS